MNDDLEKRLHSLQPADPPPDLLRRLRAAEPPAPGERWGCWVALWFSGKQPRLAAAGAGALVLAILAFAVWQMPRAILPQRPATANRVVPGRENGRPDLRSAGPAGVFPTDGERDGPFDVGSFANPQLSYTLPGGGRRPQNRGGFPLDVPTGPIRLDCGYALAGNPSNRSFLGTFNLNGSTRYEAIP